MARKSGRLSNADKDYIREQSTKKTIETIAYELNRNEEPLIKFCESESLPFFTDSSDPALKIKMDLKKSPYWRNIVTQFTSEEVGLFEDLWCDLFDQFGGDVNASEKLQIKQLITTEILMHRCLANQRRNIEYLEEIEATLTNEMVKPEAERDFEFMARLTEEKAIADSHKQSFAAEYDKYQKQSKQLYTDLKSTRNQRKQDADDSKKSFGGWLRLMEREDRQQAVGTELGIRIVAAEKERAKLSQQHRYIDGKIDRPFFNADTINLENESEED